MRPFAQFIHQRPPVTIAMIALMIPITVKNGAIVPTTIPSMATARKNSAARDNFTGLIGFSVISRILAEGGDTMNFDASELRNLGTNLGQVPSEVAKLAQVAVKKTAKDIEATAKTLAPVDTGNLRSSIGTSDLRNVSQDSPSAEIQATANYATYVELGTSRMAPQPFMRPAADKHEPAFEQAMAILAEKALSS